MSVRYETKDRVAIISLDRPEKLNAMNQEVFDGLLAAGRRAAGEEGVRAVVVRGEGRAFSSGLDTSLFGGQVGVEVDIAGLQSSFSIFEEIPVPVVAAVRGVCFGAGLQLMIACDLRVVSDDAQISAFEINWGIIPDLGATQRLPRIIGLGRAKEMVLTARPVSGVEAQAWGLANRCVAPDAVDEEALSWAIEIAAGPPLALAAAKRLTASAFDVPVHAGLRKEASAQRRMLASHDFVEAITSRMQKREPSFEGR